MAIVSAVWGTQQVAIKLAADDMAPILQVGLRSLVAALVIFIIIAAKPGRALFRDRIWRPGLVVGLLFALEFMLFARGLNYTTASRMAIFLYTAPIFAALGLALLVREERLSGLQWTGIFLAFAGIVLAFYEPGMISSNGGTWLGDSMGIAAGAAWGLTTVYIRTSRLAQTAPAVTLWYQLSGVAVLASGTAVLAGLTEIRATPVVLMSMAWQTFAISVASYLAWFSMLRRFFASRLGVLSMLTPVFGIVFGVLIMNDPITLNFLFGSALILAGILVVHLRDLLPAVPRVTDR
jgi:drug/metabolite transporter (DMT)-like permease